MNHQQVLQLKTKVLLFALAGVMPKHLAWNHCLQLLSHWMYNKSGLIGDLQIQLFTHYFIGGSSSLVFKI
jgi:hypothetical protein